MHTLFPLLKMPCPTFLRWHTSIYPIIIKLDNMSFYSPLILQTLSFPTIVVYGLSHILFTLHYNYFCQPVYSPILQDSEMRNCILYHCISKNLNKCLSHSVHSNIHWILNKQIEEWKYIIQQYKVQVERNYIRSQFRFAFFIPLSCTANK